VLPRTLQVSPEIEQILAFLRGHVGFALCVNSLEVVLELRDHCESFVPSSFELARHQSIARLYGIELTLCSRSFESRLLERELDLTTLDLDLVL